MNPQVQYLQTVYQPEQRSDEWYKAREGKITASDIAAAVGKNKYKSRWQLLKDKCGYGKPFTGNEATEWGQKYEDEAIEKYEDITGEKSHEFGLLPHPTYSFIGGSPDGITENGILLEVKCPLRRNIIPGEVPVHYLPQVLINLEVCDLEFADFIEYKPSILTGGEMELNIVRVNRDQEWFKKNLPLIESFWNEVLEWREKGIKNHPKLKTKGKTLDLATFGFVEPSCGKFGFCPIDD